MTQMYGTGPPGAPREDCSTPYPLFVTAIIAITVASLWVGLVESVRPAVASTIGNTTYYSDWFNDGTPSMVVSPLLGKQVNQRCGCTLVNGALSSIFNFAMWWFMQPTVPTAKQQLATEPTAL